eukprot:364109-Chlamydomonas_euryale.AAC.11
MLKIERVITGLTVLVAGLIPAIQDLAHLAMAVGQRRKALLISVQTHYIFIFASHRHRENVGAP